MFQHTLQQEFVKTTNHSRRITLSEGIKRTKAYPVDKREVGRTLSVFLFVFLSLSALEWASYGLDAIRRPGVW